MGHANTSANDALATMTPASGGAPAKIRGRGQGLPWSCRELRGRYARMLAGTAAGRGSMARRGMGLGLLKARGQLAGGLLCALMLAACPTGGGGTEPAHP